MKFEIKDRWTGEVQFSTELPAEIAGEEYSLQLGFAVKKAAETRANLAGANLADANLARANLTNANLARANLANANLARANLAGANLARANLADANLARAYLARANLARANLAGANLARANLARANLTNANLAGANLADANLARANLGCGLTLIGKRPYFQIGPVGSESRQFIGYLTDKGLRLRAGCFFGTRDEFLVKLERTHNNNEHAQEYRAALALIDEHARIWTPEVEA